MNGDTGTKHIKAALSSAIPKFESRHEIFDYLLKQACELDLENRERMLRDHYLAFLGMERADRETQEKELSGCNAYQRDSLKLHEAHSMVSVFLKKQLDDARGESITQLTAKLQDLAVKESDVKEQGKKYDVELERVNQYEKTLEQRAKEQGVMQSGLERRSVQLTEAQEKLKADQAALQPREIALAAQEIESDRRAKELREALSYVAAFRKYAEKKGNEFYSSIDDFTKYVQGIVTKVPGANVEDITLPVAGANETILDMGPSALPKPPKASPRPPKTPPASK